MTHAPKGSIYCVSWYWKNAKPDNISIFRFYAPAFEETEKRFKFTDAIIPRTVIRDGRILITAQPISPDDIDKTTQNAFIFKIPQQLWMNEPTFLPAASQEHRPSQELKTLTEELLANLSF